LIGLLHNKKAEYRLFYYEVNDLNRFILVVNFVSMTTFIRKILTTIMVKEAENLGANADVLVYGTAVARVHVPSAAPLEMEAFVHKAFLR
jgi:hypothetical protein